MWPAQTMPPSWDPPLVILNVLLMPSGKRCHWESWETDYLTSTCKMPYSSCVTPLRFECCCTHFESPPASCGAGSLWWAFEVYHQQHCQHPFWQLRPSMVPGLSSCWMRWPGHPECSTACPFCLFVICCWLLWIGNPDPPKSPTGHPPHCQGRSPQHMVSRTWEPTNTLPSLSPPEGMGRPKDQCIRPNPAQRGPRRKVSGLPLGCQQEGIWCLAKCPSHALAEITHGRWDHPSFRGS